MLRLHSARLNPNWYDFVVSLLGDLETLGHRAKQTPDGILSITTTVPTNDTARLSFWDVAHDRRHRELLAKRIDDILAFETRYPDVFVQMEVFQPSAIRPVLEIVDFADDRHNDIIDYVGLYQSVTSRKRVGRQMGLLVWDHGQTDHRPLIGAAVLASPRFSQRLRDNHLGWQPDYPKTSPNFDARARAVREAGLARMMQLSIACALPPYTLLAGAWLLALTPFTEAGQQAFAHAVRTVGADPDLAAVVTTTGKSPSGAPFRGHRLSQLSNGRIDAAPRASGNVYVRARPTDNIPPLRASFRELVSETTRRCARELFEVENPARFALARDVDRAAMAFALQRLGFRRSLFDGNEIGVHIGTLGADTEAYVRDGMARPASKRPRLDWDQVVAVWTKKFLPQSDNVRETATPETLALHRAARQRRIRAARSFPQERIPLSYLLNNPEDRRRLTVQDFDMSEDKV
jgi:Druantia protein DruA